MASYTRGNVFYNGSPATLTQPSQASFSLSSTARGQIERVDLDISVVLDDSDGNGLLDAWERLFFGRLGVDPLADPDHDGLDNLSESKAGTNPNDFQSQFRFIRITPQGGGVLLEWSSVTNRAYSILRSSELLTGYQPLPGTRPATPPLNSFLDATAVPPGPLLLPPEVAGMKPIQVPMIRKAIFLTFVLLGALPVCAQWTNQTIVLRPGWNSGFLEIQPEPRECDALFAGVPVESVWAWNRRFSSVQFIQDPEQLFPASRLAHLSADLAFGQGHHESLHVARQPRLPDQVA
jgi:hypothetical protein